MLGSGERRVSPVIVGAAIAAPTGLPEPPRRLRAGSVLRARRAGDQLAQALADATEQRRRLLLRGHGGLRLRLRLRRTRRARGTRLPATLLRTDLRLPVLRRLAFAVDAATAATATTLARCALLLDPRGGACG